MCPHPHGKCLEVDNVTLVMLHENENTNPCFSVFVIIHPHQHGTCLDKKDVKLNYLKQIMYLFAHYYVLSKLNFRNATYEN